MLKVSWLQNSPMLRTCVSLCIVTPTTQSLDANINKLTNDLTKIKATKLLAQMEYSHV